MSPNMIAVLRRLLLPVACVLLFTLSILTAAGLLNRLDWTCFVASQFHVQYLVAAIAMLATLVWAKRWMLSVIAAAIVIANAAVVLPLYAPHSPVALAGAAGTPLKLLQLNVNYSNRQHDKAIACIMRHDPDVVFVEELTAAWESALNRALPEYRYRSTVPMEDPHGIGIFSRVPLRNVRTLSLGSAARPSIVCELAEPSGPVTLVHTHFAGPMTRKGYDQFRADIRGLIAARPTLGSRLIVVGDLNDAPFNHDFRRLVRSLEVRDSQTGFGPQPSWPTVQPMIRIGERRYTPYIGPLNLLAFIPIDHCLVSPELAVTTRHICEYIGSDHYPVLTELVLPGPTTTLRSKDNHTHRRVDQPIPAAYSPASRPSAPPHSAAGQPRYKVISWNIQHGTNGGGSNWPRRRLALAEALNSESPDIFCLQEGMPDQLADLDRILPNHARVAVGRDDGKRLGETCAIYFNRHRFRLNGSVTVWLSSTPTKPGSSWDLWFPRICTSARLTDTQTGLTLHVLNAHYPIFIGSARDDSSRLIASMISPTEPTLLCGDFNSTPGTSCWRILEAAGLVDSWTLTPYRASASTFGIAGVPIIIDGIFLSPKIELLQHQVLPGQSHGIAASDHKGIAIQISCRDQNQSKDNLQR